jgi:cobyrinic acid a,c-diamide synthase
MSKALIIAAPNSASGKTTVTLGLLKAFRNKGLRVVSMKIGPDYIDPGFHSLATGKPCLNLDLWSMGRKACRALLSQHAKDADLVIIEGVMGLFDGPRKAKGSTADVAATMGLPVVLVIDGSHLAQSAGAVYAGFKGLMRGSSVAGVILNRVKSDVHEEILREKLPTRAVLGALRHNDSFRLPSRHLGLIQSQEIQNLSETIEGIASAVTRETNLDRLEKIAGPIANQSRVALLPPPGPRIAIAKDAAFSFIYEHLVQDWRNAGAQISFFSPLANQAPSPIATTIILPGGYPELHAARLSQANKFMESLRNTKALVYGECGGFMVLGDALVDGMGTSHRMAGLLPLTTSFAKPRLHLGYRTLLPTAGPWKIPLRGHEFHYSSILRQGYAPPLFKAADATGKELGAIGMRKDNIMGSYAHIVSQAP